jgi:centrosomal CEP192-like protein
MIARFVLLASLAPVAALAQLQVFQFDGTKETPVGGLVNVGTVEPGDTVETRFRVRNIGSGPATLTTIGLAGDGFAISSAPSLPYILAPYAGPTSEAEFRVTFTPQITGSYSAFLAVNSIDVILQGTSVAGATVMLAGSKTPLIAGGVVDFGSVNVGNSHTQGFVLFNAGSANITVKTLAVSGTGFSSPIGLTAPVQLAPGQTVPFQVAFTPQTGQAAQGTLTVDTRTFQLTGQGLDAALPPVSIDFASTLGASAQQNSLSISLQSVSPIHADATLTLAFQPANGLPDDPAISFLSGPLRKASVSIERGDKTATIDGQSSIAFQTGTTAGTIVFTLDFSNSTQQESLNISPSPVIFDSVSSVHRYGDVDVSLTGFDNTYTASELTFTFYNTKGAILSGAIPVDATSSFHQYFSSTTAGGAFSLLATFPVTGDTSQIAAVDVQITNSAGATTAQHVLIGN